MNIFTKLASFFNPQKPQNQDNISNTNSLTVSEHLSDFLENEVLNGLDISKEHFWSSFEKIIDEFSPRNKSLLQKREDIQVQIDNWHKDRIMMNIKNFLLK
jgi:malate synthase